MLEIIGKRARLEAKAKQVQSRLPRQRDDTFFLNCANFKGTLAPLQLPMATAKQQRGGRAHMHTGLGSSKTRPTLR